MIKDIVVFVACRNCNEGLHTKEYKDLEPDKHGIDVLVDKVGITHVSYEIEPDKLENQTIAEFIKNKRCRKCQHKALKELIK